MLKVLKDAYNTGKKFRVVVVDSRPKFEGKVKIVCSKFITVKRNSAAHFCILFVKFILTFFKCYFCNFPFFPTHSDLSSSSLLLLSFV